jgi:hypothetical protein
MNEDKYELFIDESYYGLFCVRNKDDTRFNSPMSFHFETIRDAIEFKRLIEIAR